MAPVPYRPRPPLSWVDTGTNENQGLIRECTPMDATRARRTKDRARQTWYAFTVSGGSHDSWGSRSRARPRLRLTRAVADPGREADGGQRTEKSTGRASAVLGAGQDPVDVAVLEMPLQTLELFLHRGCVQLALLLVAQSWGRAGAIMSLPPTPRQI